MADMAAPYMRVGTHALPLHASGHACIGAFLQDFPTAMWFMLTTMTTVGYGDFIPKSGPGRIVAGAACVVGERQ